MEELSKICEMMMLLCFAVGWPISIMKSLRTKVVNGKSPAFMTVIILGYLFGITRKMLVFDWVFYMYLFNTAIVSFDLFLYFYYSRAEKSKLNQKSIATPFIIPTKKAV